MAVMLDEVGEIERPSSVLDSDVLSRAAIGLIRVETASGCIIDANPAFCRLTGFSEAELRKSRRSFLDLIHPDDRSLKSAIHGSYVAGIVPLYTIEARYVRSDRTVILARIIVSPLADRPGGGKESFCVVIDVTPSRTGRPARARNRTEQRETLESAVAFMNENLAQSISVDAIARKTGISTRTLMKLFRRYLGSSPKKYLREIRLEHARALLKAGERVGDAAERSGFTNLGHFAAHYRRRFGELPSDTSRV